MRLHPTPPLPSPPHRAVVSAAAGPACRTSAAVERWVARRLGGVRHERQVAAIAACLFDLTRPLHGLTSSDRRLLRLAALVHDVGRCVSKASHPKKGARMLLAAAPLPLAPAERRALAYLTRHHRGPVPAPGRDAILHRNDDHGRLLLVLALLRAADTLDSRSLEPGRLVLSLISPPGRTTRPRQLRVACHSAGDRRKARRVYRRRKKFRLLEDLLGVRVDVRIEHPDALRRVA